tara:strand:- start:545 stop:724 length:180 start_codon:yes stop_codon:yes gene_type:complete
MGKKVNEQIKKKSKDQIIKDNQIILELYEKKIEENMNLRQQNKKLQDNFINQFKDVTKT